MGQSRHLLCDSQHTDHLSSLTVCLQMISIIIAALYMERSNRKAFIQKKLLQVRATFHSPSQVSPLLTFFHSFLSISQVLTKQREETLVQQKQEQESLLNSMFPKAIAKNLIAKQAEESRSFHKSFDRLRSPSNIPKQVNSTSPPISLTQVTFDPLTLL